MPVLGARGAVSLEACPLMGDVSLGACPLMGDSESTVNPVNHSARIQQVFLEHLSWAGPFTSVRPTGVLEEAPGGSWGWARGGAAVTQSGLALSHSLRASRSCLLGSSCEC